jgi:hypothetical protein
MTSKAKWRAICVHRGEVYRIERDGHFMALAMALMNDRWILTDGEERRLDKEQFDTPKAAMQALRSREAPHA